MAEHVDVGGSWQQVPSKTLRGVGMQKARLAARRRYRGRYGEDVSRPPSAPVITRVLEASGAEADGEVHLFLQEGFQTIDCDLVAVDSNLIEWRVERIDSIQSGQIDLRFGNADVAMVVRVAQLIVEGDGVVESVLELHRAHVHVGLQIIAVFEAVIVAALDRAPGH